MGTWVLVELVGMWLDVSGLLQGAGFGGGAPQVGSRGGATCFGD